METVPTASTKKMRVRSKSTSDVGDSQKNDFGVHTVGGKGKVGLNGKAAKNDVNVVKHGRDKQHDRKSRTGLRGLPKKGTYNKLQVFPHQEVFYHHKFRYSMHMI